MHNQDSHLDVDASPRLKQKLDNCNITNSSCQVQRGLSSATASTGGGQRDGGGGSLEVRTCLVAIVVPGLPVGIGTVVE